MDIKDIISLRRQELGLTYEELGNIVGVGKSTVRKWELGMIENMRRDNIVALSKALDISPALIMGWDKIEDTKSTPLSKDEENLLHNYNKLNYLGKDKLIDYSNDLIANSKYIEAKDNVTKLSTKEEHENDDKYITIAAHADGLDPEKTKEKIAKAKEIFKKMDEEK